MGWPRRVLAGQAEFTGSFTELVGPLARVRAVVLEGKNGERFLLGDEIRALSLPALRAVGVAAPRRLTGARLTHPEPIP